MKTIFITGASTGLGKAAAQLFAAKGWTVIATMRTPDAAQDLKTINNITVLPLDVTRIDQIDAAVQNATAKHKIDVVLNNAGYGLMGPFESTDDSQITRQIDTNLLGVLRVTKAFTPHFRENGGGLFVNITSIGGLATFPFSAIYHATKWALEGFSESLAFELSRFNIRVKTVAPGGIVSDFATRSLDTSSHPAYDSTFAHMITTARSGKSVFRHSTAEHIAGEVYNAVIDESDRLRYTAGPDAAAMYSERLKIGDEAFRKMVATQLLP